MTDFNPRSREGSDWPAWVTLQSPAKFQSALPRGERHYWAMCDEIGNEFQSALPRGERRIILDVFAIFIGFQSALPRGERLVNSCRYAKEIIFQSALPRGERQRNLPGIFLLKNFNPRSREGSDMMVTTGQESI